MGKKFQVTHHSPPAFYTMLNYLYVDEIEFPVVDGDENSLKKQTGKQEEHEISDQNSELDILLELLMCAEEYQITRLKVK
jgi:hypothetical protein